MQAFLREHSLPVTVSVLLHGLLAGGLLLMTYLSSQQHLPSLQPLPIDAVVVDSKVLHAAQRAIAERAEQEQAQVRAAAEAKAAAEADAVARAAEAKADGEAKAAAKRTEDEVRAQTSVETQHRVEANNAAAAAQAALEARRAAEAHKALEARQAAEARQSDEAKQAAEAAKQAADAKHAADERAKRDREAELRRQLADEEHVRAVQSGPLRDRYILLLQNKIQRAWIKPPSATAGLSCLVEVTQVPGGAVTGARVTQCNGDAAVRQSIENAVYRASPLPDPPDPALFDRNLVLRFVPNE